MFKDADTKILHKEGDILSKPEKRAQELINGGYAVEVLSEKEDKAPKKTKEDKSAGKIKTK